MKRLVVCCDGTWSKPDNRVVTNVEKIARTVQNDPAQSGSVPQLIYYISGVGASSYAADKLLGGAFGFGISHNVIACYRFLAQNYEPGDEIFVFGFSRGAYTARSLVGMIGYVGLLTKRALVEERLREAVLRYQRKRLPEGDFGAGVEEFRHDHCHSPNVRFLGVFDTVGALGVPGFRWRAPKFHDVQLSSKVEIARHALAIDETRLIFEATLWEASPGVDGAAAVDDPRVKQVWFEGSHSDVGGGYPESGLSDTALLWMAKEARAAGLVFDVSLLAHYVDSGSDPVRHDPLSPVFRIHNLLVRLRMLFSGAARRAVFVRGRRRLHRESAVSLRIASSAVNHFQSGGYEPVNLVEFARVTNGFDGIVEPVEVLPERGIDRSPLGTP